MKRTALRLGCYVVMAVGFLTLRAPAQSAAAVEAPATAVEVKYFDFFVVKGGSIAYAIIALSVVAVALTIEHCMSIRRATIVPAEVVRRIRLLIDEKNYLDAIRYTGEDPSMLGYVVHAALLEASNGFAAMERAVEETLDERAARLFRKTEYLNIIGNVSPMLGLFGTVVGMILLFAEIHAADTFPGARIVSDRIAIALITTFWGLAVAIPSLSIYAVFRNRIDVLTAECALAAEHLLSVFKPGAARAAVAEERASGAAAKSPSAGTWPASASSATA